MATPQPYHGGGRPSLQMDDDGAWLVASAADDASVARTPVAKSELKTLISELFAAFK